MKGSACQWGGVAITSASSSFTSRSWRKSAKVRGARPWAAATFSAVFARWSESTSQRATTSTPPALKAASRITPPYHPQPTTPSRTSFASARAVLPTATAPAASEPRNTRRCIRASRSGPIIRRPRARIVPPARPGRGPLSLEIS